jgi:hypothetical protein
MRPTVLSTILILAVAGTCLADSRSLPVLPSSAPSEKPIYYGLGSSAATCGASIAFSRDPGKAAAIGVPILIGGNLVAAKLFRKHPRLATLIQIGSGIGCLAGAAAVHAPKPASSSFTNTQSQNTATGGNVQPGLTGGSGSGGGPVISGSGDNGTTGGPTTTSGGPATTSGGSGGSPSGSASGAVTSNSQGPSGQSGTSAGGSTGTTTGGTTGGGTTSGGGGLIGGSTGGSTGGSIGGSTGGGIGGGGNLFCITGVGHDCGLPGNGGLNSGHGVGTIPPGVNKP